MKILCTYARFDWPIPEPKRIIDYHLSGATEKSGFEGSGCSAFNQMHPLCCIFGQYPELRKYRGAEIDRYTAKTFMTFLSNWSDKTNFYGETWLSKHNHGVVTFMTELLLDLPISRVSTIYNWRENPIITRNEDGTIPLCWIAGHRPGTTVRRIGRRTGRTRRRSTSTPAAVCVSMNWLDQASGRSRPKDLEPGLQVNAAAQYIYESQLEFSWLMLCYCQFSGADLGPYLPFIEQSVIFYDEHYRFRCKQLTGKELDENGKLVIYPASPLEHHTDARNPTSVIAGLPDLELMKHTSVLPC